MTIEHLICPACSAPVSLVPGSGEAKCSFCGSTLRIDRRDGEVALRAAEQVNSALADVNAQTQAAIGASSAAARDEMQRLLATQSLSNLELRLATIQSEIRALERMPPSNVTRQQLRQLHEQEIALQARIAEINGALYPVSPAKSSAKGHAAPPVHKSGERGCVGWAFYILAWIFLFPYMLAWTLIRSRSKPLQVLGYIWAAILVILMIVSIFSPRTQRSPDSPTPESTPAPLSYSVKIHAPT